jgi:hypothetical protein
MGLVSCSGIVGWFGADDLPKLDPVSTGGSGRLTGQGRIAMVCAENFPVRKVER